MRGLSADEEKLTYPRRVDRVDDLCGGRHRRAKGGLPFAIIDSGYISGRWRYMSRTTQLRETLRFAVHVGIPRLERLICTDVEYLNSTEHSVAIEKTHLMGEELLQLRDTRTAAAEAKSVRLKGVVSPVCMKL